MYCTRKYNKGNKKHAERMRWLGTCILSIKRRYVPPLSPQSPPTTCSHTECQPSLLTGEPHFFSQSIFFLSQCPSDVVEVGAVGQRSQIPRPSQIRFRIGPGAVAGHAS